MNTVNKHSLFNVSKYISGRFKRCSSHFVYHPEQISNEFGKNIYYYIVEITKCVHVRFQNELYFSGKTTKRNMYQAINSALDLVLNKDPSSGNIIYKINQSH